tara:strand:+ start:64 stop:273 length:210 start_codon:yes stop_codon:yes gene_type:complete
MQALSFFFFMIGIIFITIGYVEHKTQKHAKEKDIEYRFVPRSIYDEQIESVNVLDVQSDMFADIDPIYY